jgi:ABC-type branched-subunit amino acid transport system ATPase component
MSRGTTRNQSENFESNINMHISEGKTNTTEYDITKHTPHNEHEEDIIQIAHPRQTRHTMTINQRQETTSDRSMNDKSNHQTSQQNRQRL